MFTCSTADAYPVCPSTLSLSPPQGPGLGSPEAQVFRESLKDLGFNFDWDSKLWSRVCTAGAIRRLSEAVGDEAHTITAEDYLRA